MRRGVACFGLLIVAALVVSGCAPPPDTHHGLVDFWGGLWDGLTATFAFLGNLIGLGDWGVYESPNGGGWYDFGFLIGIGALFGGTGSAAS
jgi:hypothetical protein